MIFDERDLDDENLDENKTPQKNQMMFDDLILNNKKPKNTEKNATKSAKNDVKIVKKTTKNNEKVEKNVDTLDTQEEKQPVVSKRVKEFK